MSPILMSESNVEGDESESSQIDIKLIDKTKKVEKVSSKFRKSAKWYFLSIFLYKFRF